MKLTILRGIPGCGKSTHVEFMQDENPDLVVVSRDNLRNALFNRERELDEKFITTMEHGALRAALKAGKDVVSDATNISPTYVNAKIKIAYEFDAEVEIVEFDVPLDVAWSRNKMRAEDGGRFVPKNAIEKMYKEYKPFKYVPIPTFEPYIPDTSLPRCVLVDIDGTLATKGDRGYYDWHKVGVDNVVRNLVDVTNAIYRDGTIEVIIFSGRDGSSFDATQEWLEKNDVAYDGIYFRVAGDMRDDTIVKMEMFDAYIRDKYNCVGVFDDRPKVVRQWMKHNVPAFHVTPYAEDF